MLQRRAQLLARTRAFFATRDVLEVETPVLSIAGATDPHIDSFRVCYNGPGARRGEQLYLHTSPEYPMKRLLAAGSGSIYQLTRVFRDAEAGRYHNPEFTLLEWYRVGMDYHCLMDETAELVAELLAIPGDRASPERLSYAHVFERYLDLDPHRSTAAQLRACARARGIAGALQLSPDDPDPWRDLLLSHCIEPQLGQERLTFVYDYPATQAALARIQGDNPPVAQRFELYWRGIELANGFQELTDADEQRQRFEQDNRKREANGKSRVRPDENLIAALAAGMPECAGVALGFDRLLMHAVGANALSEVIAFDFDRA